ncbi:MAG: thioredoxin family protein [Anaerolineales bacterium]|nr:thioredoxin family protein [Anaerolineales bacterium]
MEKLLNEQVVGQIKQAFADLVNPVQILFFGSKENCEYCNETQQLLSEISATDEKVSLSQYDLNDDAAIAAQYKVDKAPAIVVASKTASRSLTLASSFRGFRLDMNLAR